MLDYTYAFWSNRHALLRDVLWRCDRALLDFQRALGNTLATLFAGTLPHDWREQLHACIAEQEARGYRVDPGDLVELETWIEAWAKDCGLWPESREASDSSEEPVLMPRTGLPQGEILLATAPRPKKKPATKKPTPQAEIPPTKERLPADARGRWIKGQKGNGIFQFNHSAKNRAAGIAGMKVRFVDGYIAVGGFPKEVYYLKDPAKASVTIPNPTGTDSDKTAAEAAMRKKLKNPKWTTPDGYHWNHAGSPGSRMMELVKERVHRAIAHKAYAAPLRAARRLGGGAGIGRRGVGGKGVTGRAFAIVGIYLSAREALQVAGILKPDYEIDVGMTYTFVADDGSVFIVWPRGWLTGPRIEFIEGPRKGETERITNDDVQEYRREAEAIWGRYEKGTLFRDPRFIPGTKRQTIPFYRDLYGSLYEAGWIDEDGVHLYPWINLPEA